MTNKAYEYEQWARAWDSLPVEERMPALGHTVTYYGQIPAASFRTYAHTFMETCSADRNWQGRRIQIDRITVEE